MKPDYEQIQAAVDAAAQQKALKEAMKTEQEDADIIIYIEVGRDYDRYALSDYIEDVLDDIPAVKDMTMFIK